jgi:alanine racemase
MSRVELHVDIAQFKANLIAIQTMCAPSVGGMVVIKANAYGHGAIGLAKASIEAGATYLAVASLEEAQSLKNAGIEAPILLLSEHSPKSFLDRVAITLFSLSQLPILIQKVRSENKSIKIHLKVDSGMCRLGLLPHEVQEALKDIESCPLIQVEGIFTHLSSAESEPVSLAQYKIFCAVLNKCKDNNQSFRYIHMTNSKATKNFPKMHFNMVRIGIDAYTKVMNVHTRVISIKSLKAGDKVGYDQAYCLKKQSQIAVLEMGYADGVSLRASEGGQVTINGCVYPIVGQVCMDMIFVDLGGLDSGVTIRDTAILSPTELSKTLDINLRHVTCSFDRIRTIVVYAL